MAIITSPPVSFSLHKVSNHAVAELRGEGVYGVVHIHHANISVPPVLKGEISGLAPGLHGFTIHKYGDTTNDCTSVGPHYDFFADKHAGLKEEYRHSGDLGNIEAGADGVAKFEIIDSLVPIYGQYSVIGRSLVVHAGEDDLGRGTCDKEEESLKTGNAGAPVACGVIAVAAPTD